MKIFTNPGGIVCYAILALILFQACNNEPDYKITRQEILDIHDKVMIDGEKAIKLKIRLDKIALKELKQKNPEMDTLAEKQKIQLLIQEINIADEEMSDWMHAFNADVDGKSNQEAVTYFNSQKLKIRQLDSLYKKAIDNSDSYLKRFHLIPDTTSNAHSMKM